MTAAVADVDPVAIVVDALKSSPAVARNFPTGAVSGLNEPPWPHLRVGPSPAGDDGRLEWSITAEVLVEAIGHPDGTPGRAALRRLLYLALADLAALPTKPYVSGPVVSDIVSTGTAAWVPDPASGQPRWTSTLLVTAHPPLS